MIAPVSTARAIFTVFSSRIGPACRGGHEQIMVPSTRVEGQTALAQDLKLYIGGEWVEPSSDARFDVISCATEELFFRAAEAKAADIDRAVAP